MAEATSYASKLKGEKAELVFLIKGDSKGHPAWFIAEIEKHKLSVFKEAIKSEPFDLTRYGKILYSGWGHDVPDEVNQSLKNEYNQ